jgi:hypothetical protein
LADPDEESSAEHDEQHGQCKIEEATAPDILFDIDRVGRGKRKVGLGVDIGE